MSNLEQMTFMGASVRSYTSSMGWDNQVSQLTVYLVEDDTRADVINFPEIGSPVYFIHDNFYFGGLFQNSKATQDTNGAPLYEATIIDPRELFDGVQIILSGYTGTVNVPNLVNVFGYMENNSFGSAQINESGIPWRNAVNTLNSIINSDRGNYGGPITYKGRTYSVDLTRLPNLPTYYRIGGDHISLSDLINDLCQAGNCKYFVRLNGTVIEVHTVSHSREPTPGAITRFITTTDGAVSKSIGVELRNEPISKFVVGGQVQQIYLQESDSGVANNYTDDTIWPYWGLDRYGNVILGQGINDRHTFTLDTRHLGIREVGDYYTTDVGEIRAALEGRAVWEAYLSALNYNKYRFEENGEFVSKFTKVYPEIYMLYSEDPTILNAADYDPETTPGHFYKHNKVLNPHYLKATRLRILFPNIESIMDEFLAELTTDEEIIAKLKTLDPKLFSKSFFINRREPERTRDEEALDITYQYISGIAQEFYGKKYMVKVPFSVTLESETNNIKASQEPTDSGFIDESEWATAIQSNLLPYYIDQFLSQDNKIYPYVRYDNAHLVDFSEINPGDIGFNSTVLDPEDINLQQENVSAFVKIGQQEKLVFLNRETLYSPRIVIELAGNVKQKVRVNTPFERSCINLFLRMSMDGKQLDESVQTQIINIMANSVGGEELKYFTDGPAIMPQLAGIAIKSNIQNYGPWSSSGGDGKVDFERDESLVPWNYNGYELLNLAGNAKVTDAISRQTFSESGEIEFPGFPLLSLGDILITGGPYITDIRVTGGTDGFKTTYSMRIWTPRFGKLSQSYISRFQKIAKVQQNYRKEFRRLLNLRPPDISLSRFQLNLQKNIQKKIDQSKKKSVSQISSQIVINEETFEGQVFASISDGDNNSNLAENVGSMTMDGLFVPICTSTHAVVPYIETGSGEVTSEDLNRLDATMSYVKELDGNNFPVAHRGPLILAGWGYDLDGNPVPGSGSEFTTNYKNRPDLWKAGPVDLRWDNTRKVWTGRELSQEEMNVLIRNNGLPDGDSCSKLECIDVGAVSGCSVCDTAPTVYTVKTPSWSEFTESGGDFELVYNSDCIWNSEPIQHSNGDLYYWSLDLEE